MKEGLESGKLNIKSGSEMEFLTELLKTLKIPVSSQTLVFSTTSLQLRLISPRSPRAIYFNEEISVGYIPGGKIEIVSIDPEMGAIFYIFDFPQNGPAVIERSRRCMNCHSDEDSGYVPGVLIKSVIPGPSGGSLESYRRHQTGHQIPFSERFGGWYLTGAENLDSHWGNVTGRFSAEGIQTIPVTPGTTFSWSAFPVQTSDIIAHLIHEHQAGFINRIVETHYRSRTYLKQDNGRFTQEHRQEMTKQADLLVRYILFHNEAAFPKEGLPGDGTYKTDFLADRVKTKDGKSLKDFNLKTHIFKYRCSYMIYSPAYRALPGYFKELMYKQLAAALSTTTRDPTFSYLPASEKIAIKEILRATHPDFAAPQP